MKISWGPLQKVCVYIIQCQYDNSRVWWMGRNALSRQRFLFDAHRCIPHCCNVVWVSNHACSTSTLIEWLSHSDTTTKAKSGASSKSIWATTLDCSAATTWTCWKWAFYWALYCLIERQSVDHCAIFQSQPIYLPSINILRIIIHGGLFAMHC